MGLFSRLFGSDRGRTAAAGHGASPSGASNAYDPELVPALKSDHRELLSLVKGIDEALAGGRYHEIPERLTTFKTHLEAHLLTENYRFYTYLEEQLGRDAENAALIKDFRKEMSSIARRVVQFIRTWQQSGIDGGNAARFGEEFTQVATLLKQRIDREEENLYPMYARMR